MRIYQVSLSLLILILCFTSCSRKINLEYYSKVRNILYLNNVKNEFYIKSEKSKKLNVEITNASIERKNDTTYVIKTDNHQISEMKIYEGSKKLKEIIFIKSNVPSPELTFRAMNYYESKSMRVSEARDINQFSSVIQNFSYDLSFLSSSLEIIRIDSSQNATTEMVDNSNRRFSILQQAKVGDTYIFHNIKIEVSKNEIVNGKDLVIKIVE